MPLLRYPDREAWLSDRVNGIGASEIAAILGECRVYDTPFSLYAKKVLGADPDDVMSEAAEWGLLMEPIIRKVFVKRTGRPVQYMRDWSTWVHPTIPWARASPDALQTAVEGEEFFGRGIGDLQIKTASPEVARKYWRDGPPLKHLIQIQWEMFVAGLNWGSLVCVVGGQKFLGPFDYAFSPAFIDRIFPAVAAFWQRCVDRDPPEVDDSECTTEAIQRFHPSDNGLVYEGDRQFAAWCDALERVKARRKRIDAVETQLYNRIIQRIGDAAQATLPGSADVMTYFQAEKKGFYVKPSKYRTLRRSVPPKQKSKPKRRR